MAQSYDFGNLSPIEFEALVADLLGEEFKINFELFSEGADGGIDARYASAEGDVIVQSKHYRGSTWADLKGTTKKERGNIVKLNPKVYHFVTSQNLTPARKDSLRSLLDHQSVSTGNIRGCTEVNALLIKHSNVEKRNIKLWLSSSAVLQRLLTNDIAVFTEATVESISRVLKVFVENPSLPKAAEILNKQHCLIISGPPGVGKTTLSQILAPEYCDEGWDLVALADIEDGHRAFLPDRRQVFIFDDFLGSIKLDQSALSRNDSRIAKFMSLVSSRADKRFILTTRKYILQSARKISEALDSDLVNMNEMVLDLRVYNREIKARILYNHLYHSGLGERHISALIDGGRVREIIDHPHYMPRIIEWMTDHLRFEGTEPSEYPDKFLAALDNPDKIWEKPFRDHISQEARIVLYCMFFSENDTIWRRGIDIKSLEIYFYNALDAFSVSTDSSLPETRFQDSLRELKSSFVVLQFGKVDFINPSVQDFLSRRVGDAGLLSKLASSVPTMGHLAALWKAADFSFKSDEAKKSHVASMLLKTLSENKVGGQISLDRIAFLIGDMMLLVSHSKFSDFLRSGGLDGRVWIQESELPSLVDALILGRFSCLPNAPAYGRLLRKSLYNYLAVREYVLEIDELGLLAENLSVYKDDCPECIWKAFEEAAYESIDSLELSDLKSLGDAESTVSDWLDCIGRINDFLGFEVNSSKNYELSGFLSSIQQAHEVEMAQQSDEMGLSRSSSSIKSGSVTTPKPFKNPAMSKPGITDMQIKSMFSSLKK